VFKHVFININIFSNNYLASIGLNADFHFRNFFESFWGNNEMLQNNSFLVLLRLFRLK